jgi:hypothetical protein
MLKWAFFLALLGGFVWFGSTVRLGSHTLFGHLQAISHTKESQDLLDGTKQSAKPLVDDVRRRIAGEPAPAPKAGERPADKRAEAAARPDAGPPQETISGGDRQKLRRILGNAEHATARR